MRWRGWFFGTCGREWRIPAASRRYAETLDLYRLSCAERESIRDANKIRRRPTRRRCVLRLPWRP
jgi:hypothetical protein